MAEAGRETGIYGTFLGQPPVDAALAELAAGQHVVFDLGQLRDLGLTASAVRKRAASGRLHRVHHAVYSLVPRALLTREGLWMAAVLACGAGAVLSHRSAAALLGLRPAGGTRIDVTVPARSCRQHAGIKLHRSTTLELRDTTRVKNIPCTTVARTALDLAAVLERRDVERALDQAEILEFFDLRALEDQLERNPSRPGATRLRGVLSEHYAGSTPTWNDLEDRFLALVRAAGIPQPEVNAWVMLPDDEPAIRADFVWREQRVIVETDGRRTHGTRQAFEHDRRTDLRLTTAGWRPIRPTWRRLDREPGLVVQAVLRLLGR